MYLTSVSLLRMQLFGNSGQLYSAIQEGTRTVEGELDWYNLNVITPRQVAAGTQVRIWLRQDQS